VRVLLPELPQVQEPLLRVLLQQVLRRLQLPQLLHRMLCR
jgi:hypothetical protein